MAVYRWSRTSVSLSLIAAVTLATLSGCDSAFTTHRENLDMLVANARYDVAARVLDEPQVIDQYGEKNRLLYWLERGAVALATEDPERTIAELNKADDYMEVLRTSNTGDELGKWLLNDTASPYYGSSHEDMYVSVLKLLAHLEAGRVTASDSRGGATIEARRLASKSDYLRDRFVRQSESLRDSPEYADARATMPGADDYPTDGQFVESPLGTYLSAVTFMKADESSMQDVAGRRLLSAIDLQQKATRMEAGPVGGVVADAKAFENLGSLRPSDANVLIVALSGRGPTKQPERVGPIPIYTYTLYFELPRLVEHPSRAGGARVVVEAADTASSAPLAVQPLDFIEDLSAIARSNFARELPGIYARTYIRSSAKAAAWAVGTEAARKGTSNKESAQAAVEIAGIIGGFLFVTQTEKADLRTWAFLPGQAHVGLLRLEPGRYRARVEYLSSSSSTGVVLFALPWREIEVRPGASSLTTVVEHWPQ